jgi:hypothetical protein
MLAGQVHYLRSLMPRLRRAVFEDRHCMLASPGQRPNHPLAPAEDARTLRIHDAIAGKARPPAEVIDSGFARRRTSAAQSIISSARAKIACGMDRSMVLASVADPQAAQAKRAGMAISGRPFGQEVPERLFPLFGCFCHAFEKYRRAFYWRRLAGTINFPPPRLLRTPSPLHDERIVSSVKLFTHASQCAAAFSLIHGNGTARV